MPCFKKKHDNEHTFNVEDDEDDKYNIKVEFLKKNFKLDDYLQCYTTKKILENEHYLKYTYNCENEILEFHENEAKMCNDVLSTILYYDSNNGKYSGMLTKLVYSYIEPEYNLDIFFDNPELADTMLEDLELRKQEEEEEKRRIIRENYDKNVQNKGTFDWATKTYK